MTAAVTHNTSNLAPGYKLDRYELLCPIAEGGMASVWVARQRGKHGFEKLVAIKTILPIFASDVRFQAMFLDEARIASKIEHINVAQILDLGEEHDVLYLAMEYVDGDALSKLNHACQKEGAKIPPGVLLRILADTCAGLHEAHELVDSSGKLLEIVHRDVSPHNILISTKGIAKLIDFGIAKARSRVGSDTNSGVLKGKIQYMAPEQALGRAVDRRADVWAVGVILYYLLTGKPPYEAENQLATLHLLASGRPPLPLPLTVHGAISTVVRKALAYSPDNRFQTAAELREALEKAMVDAKVPTTQADVAAFTAKHLAERAEKRRQAIDLALAAAAERRRVEELLQPTSEDGLTPAANGLTPLRRKGASASRRPRAPSPRRATRSSRLTKRRGQRCTTSASPGCPSRRRRRARRRRSAPRRSTLRGRSRSSREDRWRSRVLGGRGGRRRSSRSRSSVQDSRPRRRLRQQHHRGPPAPMPIGPLTSAPAPPQTATARRERADAPSIPIASAELAAEGEGRRPRSAPALPRAPAAAPARRRASVRAATPAAPATPKPKKSPRRVDDGF